MSQGVPPGAPVGMEAAVRAGASLLVGAGVAGARTDAETLLAHALGCTRQDVVRGALVGDTVREAARARYDALLEERARRVPLQHLTGVAHFAGLDLAVGPGVFVPRPETEVLVELAVGLLGQERTPLVVDLCTGSGAIALALAHRVPQARVVAVELSEHALAWARLNVAATGLDVELRQGAGQDAGEDLLGSVDLVSCNPPYIPVGAVPVDPEVRDHDPELALYGGSTDGLAVPLALATRAAALLRPGGVLLMEHAEGQRVALLAALTRTGAWREVTDHDDLGGRPRVTRAVRA